MALIDDVNAEIVQRNKNKRDLTEEFERERLAERGIVPFENDAPAEIPKRRRRRKTLDEMSPAEIEAFRQKKMREEEDKVLGKSGDAPKKQRRRRKQETEKPAQKSVRAQRTRSVKKSAKSKEAGVSLPKQPLRKSRSPKTPKMLQPLTLLHLLKVPGLPEGDCLAICYVKGAAT